MITLLIVADDFTGALDTGVQFAAAGAATRVVTDSSYDLRHLDPSIQVLVMDAETRHLSSRAAYEIVYAITKRALDLGVPHIYKKTDSALRGNIGSELSAVLHASGSLNLPFFPAFPKMHRCVKAGVLYIDGIPVDKSVFGRDPFEPVDCSHIPDLIRRQSSVPISVRTPEEAEFLTDIPAGITVWDGETDSELMRAGFLLQKHSGLRISAGCAGFAAVLSRLFQLTGTLPKKPAFVPSFLIICGSVNPITARQLDDAEKNGFVRIRLTPEQKLEPHFWESARGNAQLEQWSSLLRQHPCVILDSSDPPGKTCTRQYADSYSIHLDALRTRIPDSYGQILKGLMERGLNTTLMITGGDTLLGCMKQLNLYEMEPLCELEPGIVLSSFYLEHKRCHIISKSGGFGSAELLSRLAERILNYPLPI